MNETLKPQFICMTCKTVIGPIWDDFKNRCKCKDVYDYEVWRVEQSYIINKIKEPLKEIYDVLTEIGNDHFEEWLETRSDKWFEKVKELL